MYQLIQTKLKVSLFSEDEIVMSTVLRFMRRIGISGGRVSLESRVSRCTLLKKSKRTSRSFDCFLDIYKLLSILK